MRRRFFNIKKSVDINNYLTIEALEDSLTVSFSLHVCEYCIDGDGIWMQLEKEAETQSINKGQTLSFRGFIIPSSQGIGTFKVNKNFNLKGNVMSMLFGDAGKDNYSLSGKEHAFNELFYNCATLKLVSANFLPATTLTLYCYSYMFKGCTALTAAPELPATSLAELCYLDMFNGCTALTAAPELPATTLTFRCYSYMFDGCTNLNYIKMLATDISASSCLDIWVRGVSSTGTFVKSKDATWDVRGDSGVPSGWAVETE